MINTKIETVNSIPLDTWDNTDNDEYKESWTTPWKGKCSKSWWDRPSLRVPNLQPDGEQRSSHLPASSGLLSCYPGAQEPKDHAQVPLMQYSCRMDIFCWHWTTDNPVLSTEKEGLTALKQRWSELLTKLNVSARKIPMTSWGTYRKGFTYLLYSYQACASVNH